MKYLTIKVLLEYDEIVFRDILIQDGYTLRELHQSILTAFDFNGKQLASFLVTDGGIQAKEEYPLETLGENDNRLMSEVNIEEVLKEEGDLLSYIYDYVNEWKFELEVIETSEEAVGKPAEIINSYGTAPKESERDLSGKDAEAILMNAILGDEFEEEEGDEDIFDSGEFDSLDDYEEYL